MNKITAFFALVALQIGGILFWRQWQATDVVAPDQSPMKVASHYSPGQIWVDVAHEYGFFEEADLAVEVVDTEDYQQSLQETAVGRIDANTFSQIDFMNYRVRGANLVAVMASERTQGGEAVVVKSGIQSLRELKGKKIGVPKGTYLEYMLDVALQQQGIEPIEVIKVQMTVEESVESFLGGKLDAVVTREPMLGQVAKVGTVLYDSSDMPEPIHFVTAIDQEFIQTRSTDVQKFLLVWALTTEYMKQHPEEVQQLIAAKYGVAPSEVATLMGRGANLDLQANVTLLGSNRLAQFYNSSESVASFYESNGMTLESNDASVFLNNTFITELAANNL